MVKSRKIGVTETILRRAAYRCLTAYAGRQVLFISSTMEFSELMMNRFLNLFDNSPYEELIVDRLSDYCSFRNGCEVYSRPSTPQSLRSFDRVKGIYLDEAAHFGQLDDEKVYAAMTPNLINTQGDYVMVSSPRGPRGFFYRLYKEKNEFRKFELPYTVAPELIAQSEIEKEKLRLGPLFAQEYECSFLASGTPAIEPELIDSCFDPNARPSQIW
ncbi:MAG: terminase large subunit domain-containing protein [Nitrososphaerales archaeon]